VAQRHHHGGGPESYCRAGYNQRPLLDFLLPLQQTAQLCGMRWLPPFVLHSFHKLEDPEALRAAARTIANCCAPCVTSS
jgi:putative NADPH-quinone reductase